MEQSLSDLGIEANSPVRLSVTDTDGTTVVSSGTGNMEERVLDAAMTKDAVAANGSIRFITRLFGSEGEAKEKKS